MSISRALVSFRPLPSGAGVWEGLLAVALLTALGLQVSSPDAIWEPVSHEPGLTMMDMAVAWRSAWRDLALVIRAAAVAGAVLVYVAARGSGTGVIPAVAAALGLAFSGLYWARSAAAHEATVAACLSLATVGSVCWWVRQRRWTILGLTCLCYASIVAVHPPALAGLPVLMIAAAIPVASRPRSALAVAAGLTAAAGLGVMLWALGTGAEGWFGWFTPGGWWSDTTRFADGIRLVLTDFGVLALGFLLAGTVKLLLDRAWWMVAVAGWALALAVWMLASPELDWRSGLLPALAPLWLIVAHGMSWVCQPAAGPTATRVAIGLVLLLPAMQAVANHWPAARAHGSRLFVDRYMGGVGHTPSGTPRVFIYRGILGAQAAARVGRSPSVPAESPARGSGSASSGETSDPIVVFAGAQPTFRQLGFQLTPVAGRGVPMTLNEFLATVPDGWIVALATGDHFASSLPPADRPTFQVLAGSVNLFGKRQAHYALIGVKGSADRVIEGASQHPVDVSAAAGDALGTAFRMPVPVRVTSDAEGGAVEFQGNRVAHTRTGLALAIVTPSGQLTGVVSIESAGEVQFVVDPPPFSAAAVTGREPCAEVRGDRWTDVSAPASLDSLAGVLDPGQRVVVYLGRERPLQPRRGPLDHWQGSELRLENFDRGDSASAAALDRALRADAVDETVAVGPYRFVSRVEAASPGTGHTQLAVRLGGFAEAAYARLTAGHQDSGIDICAELRGGEGLLAEGQTPESGRNEFSGSADALFVSGWGGLEHADPLRYRWALVPEAEILVPLARAQSVIIEIEILPVVAEGATLRVRVNERDLDPVALQSGWHAYRWAVPAEAWRAGLNRMWIGTREMVRPIDIGVGDDGRLLGIAVSRVRVLANDSSG